MSSVELATRTQLPRILELLEEADLPLAGVAEHAELFWVARDGSELLGCVGLETYEDVGLLRSLVVRPTSRGSGVGELLVEALVENARAREVTALYLLTTTAEAYFPRFGFEVITREDADSRLSASEEFRGACPDSAVCMRRRL
jgi:amino-acid N-acetyltransferase